MSLGARFAVWFLILFCAIGFGLAACLTTGNVSTFLWYVTAVFVLIFVFWLEMTDPMPSAQNIVKPVPSKSVTDRALEAARLPATSLDVYTNSVTISSSALWESTIVGLFDELRVVAFVNDEFEDIPYVYIHFNDDSYSFCKRYVSIDWQLRHIHKEWLKEQAAKSARPATT